MTRSTLKSSTTTEPALVTRARRYPGWYLTQILREHGLTPSRLARHIGVQTLVVNQICKGKRRITLPIALKLSRALGTTPRLWLNLQMAYDLDRARKPVRIKPLIRVA